jgi:polar amino acid transport system substrate-binding protein
MRRLTTKWWPRVFVISLVLSMATSVVAFSVSDSASLRSSGGELYAQATGSDTLLDRLRKAGVIKIAVANEPPYTEVKPDGTVTGMVPELVKAVMARLGVPKVQGVVTSYETMIPGLQAGQWDLVAAGLTQTAARCQQILFSEPDTVSYESIISVPSKNVTVRSYADIAANPQIKMAVVPGTLEERTALAKGVKRDRLVAVPDAVAEVDSLKAGRADVTIMPTLSAKAIKGIEAFKMVKVEDGQLMGTGVAFRKADRSLRDAFNAEFRKLKEDGTFVKLSEQFGFDGNLAIQTKQGDIEPTCANN